MEQDASATPLPKNKENNPLESRLTTRSKATSGVVYETASLHRRSEASESSSGKNTISHATKSLLPHTTVPALGKKSKNNPRSPLPSTFQGQASSTTPALASMSENELMEAHLFHSRQAHAHLEELVRRRHPPPPAWVPPKNWQVSQASEHSTLAKNAEQPRLRDIGSLASVDEESFLAGPSDQARKDSALTQDVRTSVASAGGRRSSKVVRDTKTTGGYIASVSREQRGVIIARKAGSRAKDSFILKNAVCNSSNEDQETAEWITEDDTGLFRMPGRSISTVKIKTYLEADTSLLHLDLRTAIPLKSESSRVDTRGSNEKSQRDQDEDALAEPDTDTQEPGKTTKPLDASNYSGAEGRLQSREASNKDKDADIPLETYLPGPDDDCRPPTYVEADAQYWSDLFHISKGARSRPDTSTTANRQEGTGCLRGGCDNSQELPPTPRLAQKTLALVHLEELDVESDTDIRFFDLESAGPYPIENTSLTRTHSEPTIHLASPKSSERQGCASKTMPRGSSSHVGEGFRRTKLRKKAERPSSFYRAPEIQEKGRTLERDSDQEGFGLGIGLGISMADEGSIPEKADSEWQGEEMADDPKIQNYSSRRPSLLIRRKTERLERTVLPRADDPVVAIQRMLLEGGALVRTGREEDEGLICVSVDAVRIIRDGRRRKREEKEEHQQELDQFVANFEQSQHQEQPASEKPQEEQRLDRDLPAKETEFESVPNTDGAQESSLSCQTQSSHRSSDNDRDRSSSVGSNTSSRTAFRTRDVNTTPRPGDLGINNTLGKSQSSVARPLPPPPTFPPDLLDPSHPDDHEDFVSLNDPSIRHHLARALSNIYSGDMAAQNPAMANSAAPYTLGGGMPSAGHHSDMQHIWSLVQELSSVLQQNREQYDELQ
ncbi:hypothetical protein KCU71_g16669, partial [Aureobasidium melanogenum]